MNIQSLFLLTLYFILLAGVWRKTFPNQQFLQLHCNVGEITRPSGLQSVIDCSSCLSFPLDVRQAGVVTIRSGSPQQQKSQHPQKQYEVYANLYMQKECIEYQCRDLLSSTNFANEGTIGQAGLIFTKEVWAFIDEKVWQVEFQYDNHFKSDTKRSSLMSNFITNLLGDILPSVFLPSQQFFRGMAIKFRSTKPIQNIENINKPIIKITQHAQTKSNLISISLIIAFTLAVKSNLFHFDRNIKVLNLFMCFGFASPYLFSLFALVLLILRDPLHLVSLFFFVIGLSVDYGFAIVISVGLSSIFLFRQPTKIISLNQIFTFNFLILLAALIGIQDLVSSSIILLYTLCEDILATRYQKIENREKNQGEIQMKQSEGPIGLEE